jgi:hypothetical protein
MAEDCTPEIETAALLLPESKADADRLRFGFVNRSWSEATLPCFMAVLRRNWIRTQIGSGDYLAKGCRRLGSVRGRWILASGTGEPGANRKPPSPLLVRASPYTRMAPSKQSALQLAIA